MNAQRSTLNAQRSTPVNGGARRGFTLLELLAVMAIMAMLATLAVTSYFGAIRGMARRGAGEHFLNALTQARQRACIDGAHVSLIAFNQPLAYDGSGNLSKLLPSYVVCRELGRVSFVKGNYLFDEFADLKQLFGKQDANNADIYGADYKSGIRLYNLTQGYWGMVIPKVSLQDFGNQQKLFATSNASYDHHSFKGYALEIINDSWAKSSGYTAWKTGDVYGVEVTPIINLPKTFYFEQLSHNATAGNALKDIHYVTFAPDGTSVDQNGGKRSVTFTIKSDDPQAKDIIYTVEGNGKIN